MLYFLILFFSLNLNLDIDDNSIFYNSLKKGDYKKSLNWAKSTGDELLHLYAEILYFDGNKDIDSLLLIKNLKTTLKPKKKLVFTNLIKGIKAQSYSMNNLEAFKFYHNALVLAEELKHRELIKEVLIRILNLYEKEIFYGNNQHEIFLKKFEEIKENEIDEFLYLYFKLAFITKTIYEISPIYETVFKEFEMIYTKNEKVSHFSVIYFTEKALKYRIAGNFEESMKYFIKSFQYTNNSPYYKSKRFALNLNLGDLSLRLNKNLKAKKYFNECKKYFNKNRRAYDLFYYHRFISNYFNKEKKNDSAYFHLNKSINIEYDLEYKANALEISQLNKFYQTEKKEKENLQLKQRNLEIEAKRKLNLYSLVTSISILILGIAIGALTLKNSKRKRKLAEQEKELETQKNLTLIKEQEITTINAMVDGQEKERKRIAEDLHDNLGSVLATLKLHFENLKINREKQKINQEELFNKTENLIDEAYLKVRRIAHAKNAGVIANQGLLLAVQMMAKKISSADKINIEVVHFGLDKRLENSLELTVFRIIQELVTNILKHAEARKATINISLYDKNLNIIIEDNGKGFDINKVNMNNGMGLSSIKTRIEHLQGTFQVDATLGKGSAVIIDIPLS